MPYNATDPDGDPLNVLAQSDNPGVVNAFVSAPGTISLSASSAGTATITVTVDDGRGGTAQDTFAVTVSATNSVPVLSDIPDQQMTVGNSIDVTFSATDPDGDPLTLDVTSSDPSIVSFDQPTPGVIHLTAQNAGTATITVTVDDGRGGTAQDTFTVTVSAGNSNPTLDDIADQTMTAGDTLDVPYNATDPDGDALNVLAQSDNPGVANAFVSAPGTISLSASSAGTATITVLVDDGRGGSAMDTFTVTVSEAVAIQPTSTADVNAEPYLTPIENDVLDTIRNTYQSSGGNTNPGVFSTVGDTPPSLFLSELGDGSANFADLSDATELNDLTFYYNSTALPTGGNSFTSGGLLASNTDWRVSDLLDTALADPAYCQSDETPLHCELRVDQPAVVFVIVGRNDLINGTSPDEFQATLDSVISEIIDWGAIPVLATIPGDPNVYPALAQYNEAILTLANDYDIPVINSARAINELGPAGLNPDLTPSSPGYNDTFGPGERQYGEVIQNLLALRMLQQIRLNVPIP